MRRRTTCAFLPRTRTIRSITILLFATLLFSGPISAAAAPQVKLDFPMSSIFFNSHRIEPGFGFGDYVEQWYNCEDKINPEDLGKPRKHHAGIDVVSTFAAVNCHRGTADHPVYAVGDGVIAAIKEAYYPGDTLTLKLNGIRHNGKNVYAFYGHIEIEPDILDCFKNQVVCSVQRGQKLGTVGAYSNLNSHLHFEMRYAENANFAIPGYTQDPPSEEEGYLDPCKFIEGYDGWVPLSCKTSLRLTTEVPWADEPQVAFISGGWNSPIRRIAKEGSNTIEISGLTPQDVHAVSVNYLFDENRHVVGQQNIDLVPGVANSVSIAPVPLVWLAMEHSGLCLERQGTSVKQQPCRNIASQQFQIAKEESGWVSIRDVTGELCLFSGSDPITMNGCANAPYQSFKIKEAFPLGGTFIRLAEANGFTGSEEPTAMCVQGEGDSPHDPLTTAACWPVSLGHRPEQQLQIFESLSNEPFQISSGRSHSCGVWSSGQVYCWGRNHQGQLGDGTNVDSPVPVPVVGLDDAVLVSAGGFHTCALRVNGQVNCWGDNFTGQLGNGTRVDSLTPVVVDGQLTVLDVSAGWYHTCAIDITGQTHCWGDNVKGQLGDGTQVDRLSPVPTIGLSNTLDISLGAHFSCALNSSSQAFCWGHNETGNLGDGTTIDRLTPVPVSNLGSVLALETGSGHSCVIEATGQAKCWGNNGAGQLGDGSTTDRLTPVAVQNFDNAKSISAGGSQTCALDASDQAYCWGSNLLGQLGNGSNVSSPLPVQVTGMSNTESVSAGLVHSCARDHQEQVFCWGSNFFGELGDGTFNHRNVPAPIVSP